VVETIMIFALGFVAAALIALLIIPAVNARAERLARRRAETLFPMSIAELTAEKDHLRAEFAVLQRRIERKAEEALAAKHQSMEEMGRRAVRIEALEGALAAREQTISQLEATLADTQDRLAAAEEELEQTKTFLSGTRETLAALENAHRATLDELSNTRMELEQTQNERSRTKTELIQTQERFARLEAEYADTDSRLTGALSELDTKRITISDLETRLMTQTSRGNDFERALNERQRELSDERQRLNELARSLAAEQERGMILEQRTREIENERDEAQKRLTLQESFGGHDEELRRQITQVAAQIMQSGNGRPRNGRSRNDKRRRSAANRDAQASSLAQQPTSDQAADSRPDYPEAE
jgi:predicted  nucleic acid-binding Zn-ribbon protein